MGGGFWAAYFYLPFLAKHPEAQCIGVVRPGGAALAALQRLYELDIASEDIDELLAADCDGVIVASPHSLHAEHAIRALHVGSHVLVEKPMALSARDADAIATAVAATGRSLTIAHGFNYMEMSTWAIDLVRSGALGRPISLIGFMASALEAVLAGEAGYGRLDIDGVVFEAEPATWADRAKGGGYLYGQMSHLVGLALAFVEASPANVFARTRLLPNGVDIDTALSVEFADGTLGSFTGSGQLPWGVRYPLDLRIVAERGILNLDFDRERADAFVGPSAMPGDFTWAGEEAFAGRPPDFSYSAQSGDGLYTCAGPVEYLINRCLGRDAINRAPVSLGRRAVEILETASASSTLGRTVSVGRTDAMEVRT